jgi:hypothetical protein
MIIIVFYATFNTISVISWRSILLLEETGVPGENKPQTCCKSLTNLITVIEELGDTKGAIRIRISKKNRKHKINTTGTTSGARTAYPSGAYPS